MNPERLEDLEAKARDLLRAMDKQHGSSSFSQNVQIAREALGRLFADERSEADRADRGEA